MNECVGDSHYFVSSEEFGAGRGLHSDFHSVYNERDNHSTRRFCMFLDALKLSESTAS